VRTAVTEGRWQVVVSCRVASIDMCSSISKPSLLMPIFFVASFDNFIFFLGLSSYFTLMTVVIVLKMNNEGLKHQM
jgi:hypothetical protein